VAHKPKTEEQSSLPTMERVYIRLDDSSDQALLMSLKETIDANQGETEVVLVLGPAANKQIVKLPIKVDRSDGVMDLLASLVGAANLKLQ